MKPTLDKLNIVIKAHIEDFLLGTIPLSLFCLVFRIGQLYFFEKSRLAKSVSVFAITKTEVLLYLFFMFFCPVFIYLVSYVTKSSMGTSVKVTNSIKARQILFFSSGLLWSSAGVICLGLVYGTDYIVAVGGVASIISWVLIHKTIRAYVVL